MATGLLFGLAPALHTARSGLTATLRMQSGRASASRVVRRFGTVAIINEAFARKFNLGADQVGRRMRIGAGRPLNIEIVGLVRDASYSEVKEAPPPQFFVPFRQTELGALTFYVRSSADSRALQTVIPGVVQRIDSTLPIENLRTMTAQVRENVSRERMLTTLSTTFGALATLLAAVGLYGVLAHTVAQRWREIGIRMAIGATQARVRAIVLRQVIPMAVVGCATGVIAALGLSRLARSLVFALDGHDPAALAAAVAGVIVVALGAGIVPAWRASRLDPAVVLRAE
jgi:ABC-type antimicrobial peptide transport system permease subunit